MHHLMHAPGAHAAYAVAFGLLLLAAMFGVRLLAMPVDAAAERMLTRPTPAPSPAPAPTPRGDAR